MRKFWGAALLASLVAVPAYGHGGGGGHYVYIPVYVGSQVAIVPPTQVGDYSNIHTVAVISAIGQTMTLGKDTVIGTHSALDIADWNFDHGVEETVARDLTPRFTVKQLAHDSAALAAIPNGHWDTSSAKKMQAYIMALPDRSVDAFVIIRPDAETGTPITPGLSLDATPDGKRPEEETNFEIDIVNAQTGAILAHAFSRAAERQGLPPQFATFWGSPDARVMPNGVPTNAQRNQMKKDFERNISLALRETLRSLNLGITLPEVGARTFEPLAMDENPAVKFPKIMVVSVLGDSVEVDYPGSLFRSRKDQTYSVADWNLDAGFEKTALAALDKHFTPVTVPVDRAKLSTFVFTDAASIAAPVPGITPGTPGVDLYLVFAKAHGTTNDNTTGLTMWTHGSADNGAIFCQYDILLIAPKTGRIVMILPGTASPKFPSPMPQHITARANIPNPDATGFAPDQAATARTMFAQLMDDSIEETLLHMHLTGKKTVVGGDIAEASLGDGTQQSPPPPASN